MPGGTPGVDGRTTTITLTAKGARAAARIAAARAAVLADCPGACEPVERVELQRMLGTMLAEQVPPPGTNSMDLPPL